MNGSALVDRIQVSENHEPRTEGAKVCFLVLHYTGMKNGAAAVDWLCNPDSRVSCHYLIDMDGSIVQMVSEDRRAWHAGVSSWNGTIDINSHSIGIEIQNEGHVAGCPRYPDVQMQRVGRLCIDIMHRHGLSPCDVVGHSDIAPGRKVDPGEAFDWSYLASLGVGQMVRVEQRQPRSSEDHLTSFSGILRAQAALTSLGYGLDQTGIADAQTKLVVEAFQRRYSPNSVDGLIEDATLERMERLLAIRPKAAFGTM